MNGPVLFCIILGFIVCVVVLLVVAGFFVSKLIAFKNKGTAYQEKIKKAKSDVRLAQNKYVKALRNTEGALGVGAENVAQTGMVMGDIGSASKYDTNTELVCSLANAYERAQNILNDIISQYNNYISIFPNLIYAKVLRYKREAYIDEQNLDKTMMLNGIDESIV